MLVLEIFLETEFISHCRDGNAECLNGVEGISEVERKLVCRTPSKLHHEIAIWKQPVTDSQLT